MAIDLNYTQGFFNWLYQSETTWNWMDPLKNWKSVLDWYEKVDFCPNSTEWKKASITLLIFAFLILTSVLWSDDNHHGFEFESYHALIFLQAPSMNMVWMPLIWDFQCQNSIYMLYILEIWQENWRSKLLFFISVRNAILVFD